MITNPQATTCPSCGTSFTIQADAKHSPPKFCPYCSKDLPPLDKSRTKNEEQVPQETTERVHTISLVQGHDPVGEKIAFTIGPYQVLRSIGKGGMGEVYQAYDTSCGRRIALKRIREDLQEHKQMHNRFLKEARITSQLTHPSIIPIYSIYNDHNLVYYTMPFVQGNTLKQILRHARQQEKKGEKLDHIGASIPALLRIFLSICQAIAYAHSKGVLHRDIKPENIIVGQYGEVLLLDWGLAKLIRRNSSEDPQEELPLPSDVHPLHQLTHIGRVVGTVSYMAPERALGNPATFRTDIYSLGVILYQILTLRSPFKRTSLKIFRETMEEEVLIAPEEVAPYRDVPRSLSRVVLKCLAKDPEQRYESVDDLVRDIENYIEGRSEWFLIAELHVEDKNDWEFQENVLIAEHIAITRGTEISAWVSLMISKASFTQNTKVEAQVRIGAKGHGLGFLLSIPEASERLHLNDGYCLWLGSDLNKSTKLLRSTVEVIQSTDIFLKRNEWYKICIEKIDNNIHFYLNDQLQFSYISHLPQVGTHIGLLSRDADFLIKDFMVYVGSQNIMVNCLAVPDAFLAHKDYSTALSEYRRIGYSFPGRAEGREAMFRAGITLLEQAQESHQAKEKGELFDLALEEFEKLHTTPGAPLEYLGKALVYQSLNDCEEEIKCFELACRRYPMHPLLPVLQEQVVYRLHESSRLNRKAAYSFILLTIRQMPAIAAADHVKKLFTSLQKNWEPLFFLENEPLSSGSKDLANHQFAIALSFWLAKPYILAEIIDDLAKMEAPSVPLLCNSFFCLIELGSWEFARQKMEEIFQENVKKRLNPHDQNFDLIRIAIAANANGLKNSLEMARLQIQNDQMRFGEERLILYLIQRSLKEKKPSAVFPLAEMMLQKQMSAEGRHLLHCYQIWAYLQDKQWNRAGELLHQYSLEDLSQDSSLLHFLYGCWLYVTEGKEIANIHYYGCFEVAYPHSTALFSHYISGKITESQNWFNKAFLWEKRSLYQQISLFYDCIGDSQKMHEAEQMENKEYIYV
jgi:serine/threonine-protein kinase